MEEGITYKQVYNAENRIASIAWLASGDCTTPGNYAAKWDFSYDGDGVHTNTLVTPYDANGLPQTASLTSYFFGGAYEVTGSNVRKYYSFAGQMVAMRDGVGLKYLLTDHLGSIVAVTAANGTLITQQRYLPFGGERTDVPSPQSAGTDYGYTGQRLLDEGMGGLMDYKARFYSPYLNRFIQPDTLIPGVDNLQSWNRYSYVNNRPIIFNDPTGHYCADEDENGRPIRVDCKTSKIFDSGGGKGGKGGKVMPSPILNNQSSTITLGKALPPRVIPPCPLCSLLQGDASLISFSFAVGWKTYYRVWGVDIVITSDEVGIFGINATGKGFGSERDPYLIPDNQMEKTYMSPQISASLYFGPIWGKSLKESVTNYKGPAIVEGGSLGPGGAEYFESVDVSTGIPNGNIRGIAGGPGLSIVPLEFHDIYTDAEYWFHFGY